MVDFRIWDNDGGYYITSKRGRAGALSSALTGNIMSDGMHAFNNGAKCDYVVEVGCVICGVMVYAGDVVVVNGGDETYEVSFSNGIIGIVDNICIEPLNTYEKIKVVGTIREINN